MYTQSRARAFRQRTTGQQTTGLQPRVVICKAKAWYKSDQTGEFLEDNFRTLRDQQFDPLQNLSKDLFKTPQSVSERHSPTVRR